MTKAMNTAVPTKQCSPDCMCHAQSVAEMRDASDTPAEHRTLLTMGGEINR